MKRTFPTLALIGVAALSGLALQQTGRADAGADPDGLTAGFAFATDADAARVDRAAGLAVAEGPHADAIRALLSAAPGPDRDAAAADFRASGPDGFAALREALAPVVADYSMAKRVGATTRAAELEPVVRLLDQVAAQRDAYAAGLYWHTDIDDAKQQAQATGKPILSLRMLGNLDDEYSCANSRFFRTVLYADAQLGETLRENFVLHWQSVRPVPVITIDMGDGRVIRRTITGNSCHLVLDPQGRPVDVIPGLYGPRTFEEQVNRAGAAVQYRHAHATTATQRRAHLIAYHRASADRLDQRWAELTVAPPPIADVAREDFPVVFPAFELDVTDAAEELSALLAVPGQETNTFPDAHRAALLAGGKGVIEVPVLDAIAPNPNPRLLGVLASDRATVSIPARDALSVGGKRAVEEVLVDAVLPRVPMHAPADASAEVWDSVAAFYAQGAVLDGSSRMLMHHKAVPAEVAGRMAFGKMRVEDPLLAMVQNFQGAIALDTARNEHLLHREIHRWFVEGEAPLDADELTSRVYAELFLTPDEDPWLGLVPADTYSALDDRGLETCE